MANSITPIEYALMAGNAYQSTRLGPNIIPLPGVNGWSALAPSPLDHVIDDSNGFEATAYKKGSEIVISFAGTYFGSVFPGAWKDVLTDLELGVGNPDFLPRIHDGQLYQAAKYYEQVKQLYPPEQGYTISFTGHSLGGGLAALMGVLFDKNAVTFDQAPFREAATMANRNLLIEYLATNGFGVDADLAAFYSAKLPGLPVRDIRGEEKISTIAVAREFLTETLPGSGFLENSLRIGREVPTILEHGWTEVGFADRLNNLHSIALLTVLQRDHDLGGVLARASFLIPNLLQDFFDARLPFVAEPDTSTRNLLEHLLRHQFGVPGAAIAADGMLDAFIHDIGKLVGGGALQALSEGMAKTLMQGYEKITGPFQGELLVPVAGGYSFAQDAIVDSSGRLDGYRDLLGAIDLAYGSSGSFRGFDLSQVARWHIQSGDAGLQVRGDERNDAMLGGVAADSLEGAAGNDTLFGGAGDDVLTGGTGNDTLIGGAGSDTYRFTSGDGQDRIIDADGQGQIVYDGVLLAGGKKTGDGRWQSNDNRFFFALLDGAPGQKNLVITTGDNGDRITIVDFQSGRLGIALNAEMRPDVPSSFDAFVYGDGTANVLRGSNLNDRIEGLGGDDRVEALGRGQDLVLGGDGNDRIWNDDASDDAGDTLQGNAGSDIVLGGGASDRVFGGDEIALDEALAQGETQAGTRLRGDWVDGHINDDVVIGGAGNDALWGGDGSDLIVGGAGDDNIGGDLGTGYVQPDWSPQRSVTQSGTITIYGLTFDGASVAESQQGGGNDLIWAGAGDDWIFAGRGGDFVDGGSGDDIIFGGAGSDELLGGVGADVINGDDPLLPGDQHGNDVIFGGDGDDRLFGGGGSDRLFGGDGADTLVGDEANLPLQYQGNDELDGGAGDDTLYGVGGDDTLSGGTGRDLLIGGLGNDTLYGDEDDDELQGNEGNDLLFGGTGIDKLFGGAGGDFLYGEAGNDYLFGEDDDDSLFGGDGDDQLGGGSGSDSLSGGNGADRLYGDAGDDFLDGGDGDDQLAGGDGNDALYGDNGNDLMLGDAGFDTLYGGAGADELQGGEGDDFLSGGDDRDLLLGQAGNDLLLGDAGDDELQGGDGADVLFGGFGADRLFGGLGDDALYGDESDDTLYADDGNDVLLGGTGDDVLYGDAGFDRLSGGAGNDLLFGGLGDDTYLFQRGDGADTIVESGDTPGDRIVFGSGIDPNTVRFAQRGSALVFVTNAEMSDQIAVANWYYDVSLRVGSAEFDDGTVWDSAYLAQAANNVHLFLGDAGNNTLYGGFGDDSLYGLDGDDTLNGGPGNNVLVGGRGNDRFIAGPGTNFIAVSPGDGNDVIENAGAGNTILGFGAGVSAFGLSYDRVGNDLAIHWSETTTVKGWFAGNALALQFADGSSAPGTAEISQAAQNVSRQYVIARGSGVTVLEDWGGFDSVTFGAGILPGDISSQRVGLDLALTVANPNGSADQVTVKGWFDDATRQIEEFRFTDVATIVGNRELTAPLLDPAGTDGADVLVSGAGYVETVRGLAGDDSLIARGGGDILIGGTGNDRLYGSDGTETYVFNTGDGQDTIQSSRGFDTVLVDRPWSAISVARSGSDDVITFVGSSDRITVTGYWLDTSAYEFRVLGTMLGTPGTDSIIGSALSDAIFGFGGDDTLNGMGGYDELHGGDGNDTLDGGIGFDRLYGDAGNDVLGGAYASDDYYGSLGDGSGNYYDGGAGSDLYRGTRGNDVFFIGVGNGADTITQSPQLMDGGYYVSHGGDRLSFAEGIAPDQVAFAKSGTDLLITISAQDRVTVQGWFGGASTYYRIDNFDFVVNGQMQTVWTAADATRLALTQRGTAGADTLTGTSDDDALYGLGGDDTLMGLAGDDLLDGGTGNDSLLGGFGNDIYLFGRGSGRDLIDEQNAGSAADRVQFGEGISASDIVRQREGNDLVLAIAGTSDALVVRNALSTPGNRVEQFVFADGSRLPTIDEIVDQLVNVIGTAGNDVLLGSSGIDVLRGLDGNDVLTALGDADTLDGGAGDDTLNGGAGADLLLGGAGNDTYVFNAGHGVDTLVDNDGTSRLVFDASASAVDARVNWSGSAASLVLTDAAADSVSITDGYANRDKLELAFAGNAAQPFGQWLASRQATGFVLQHNGSAGSDVMTGTAESDALHGGVGDDVLDGGAGNDTLDGGAGFDIYCFGKGYGVDTVVNETASSGESTVRLNPGTGLADLVIQKQGKSNLVFALEGTADQLIVQNYVSGKTTLAVGLSLADGTTYSSALLAAQATRLGTASADTVRGGSGADRLYGFAGNDTLQGKAGDDWLYGGAGNDRLEGGAGADTYMFSAGWGQDVVSETGTDGAVDTILFGGGIGLNTLTFNRSGSNLLVNAPDGSKITVENWYAGGPNQVEQFADADGHVLLSAQVQQLAQVSAAASAKSAFAVSPTVRSHGGHWSDTLAASPMHGFRSALSGHFRWLRS